MKTRILAGLLCCVVAGCGARAPTVTVAPNSFDGPDEVVLKGLLDKPRSELASLAVELEQQLQRQDKMRREGQLKLNLLSTARVPHAPAVWREAKFSETHGFSVPPYLKEGAKDTPLALHLARHGDVEAALKLADSADGLKEHSLDRNYPLEWTRLVSLHLQHAQFILASGNFDGGKKLVSIHRQLRDLLPANARSSALGQALLPRGLTILKDAAEVWKKDKRTVSQDAEAWLAKFEAPAWTWPLPTDRAGVLGALGNAKGQPAPGVLATTTLRALDLAALLVPHDAADACWVFFDGDNRLTEYLVAYRPEMSDFEQAAQWAPDLARQSSKVHAVLSATNSYVGAVVQAPMAAAAPSKLPREIGPLSLDRTFESNRRLFAWKQGGGTVGVNDARTLAALPLPLGAHKLARGEIEAGGELVQEFTFKLAIDGPTTLATIARPLWEKLGSGKVEQDAGIDLVWNDGRTRYRLRAPEARLQPIALGISDSSGQDEGKRLADARARDLADRQTRLATKQHVGRLPRYLENVTLGMKKADVDRVIPASAVRREFPGGLMAVFPGQVKGPGDTVPREIFARFDDAQEVVELRVRYFDLPNNKPGTFLKKLDALKASNGPGVPLPTDASAFSDLPARKLTLVHLGWQDDVTCLTARTDGNGLEVVVRDCPPSQPAGISLAPFAYLGRGVENLTLGMPRSDVLKLGATAAGDALLVQNKSGPHDSVLVWFEGDKAARIAARLRLDPATIAQPAKALPEAWVREVRNVGWPWRQDFTGKTLQGWTTLDAQTRYRIFVQEDNQGTHLLAEWKDVRGKR